MRALTAEWIAFCNGGVISKCAARILSLVDIVEPIGEAVVPGPVAIVARVTFKPNLARSLVPVCCAESGTTSSVEFFLASSDIVAVIVEEGRGVEGDSRVDPR